jgi:phosphate:Na+ symporter
MLGADVGTALMAVVFSFDLSWLSPAAHLCRRGDVHQPAEHQHRPRGPRADRPGPDHAGAAADRRRDQAADRSAGGARAAGPLPNEVLLDILVGAVLAVLSYSSLAIVLLTATLAAQGMLPVTVALGLVLGANVGSGVLAMLVTSQSKPEVRRLPLGNFSSSWGRAAGIPLLGACTPLLQQWVGEVHQQVVLFHLGFNALLALLFIGFTGPVARLVERCCPSRPPAPTATARATWTRWRWPRPAWPSAAPRARRCTRPTWWRPCCAACCR